VKLTAHPYLVPRLRMLELYLHLRIRVHLHKICVINYAQGALYLLFFYMFEMKEDIQKRRKR
jgi:hypothetical protein